MRAAKVILVVGVMTAAMLAVDVPDHDEAAAQSDDSSIEAFMLSLETGVSTGATSELAGWTTSALGLSTDETEAEILDELGAIEDELVDIDNELEELNTEIDEQTCDLESIDTTTTARSVITTLNETLEQFQEDGATDEQLEDFVEDVLEGSDPDSSVTLQMSTINDALLDAGTAQGIISACLGTLAGPTDGTVGDTDYYDAVQNLTMFYYGYQVQGLNLIVEAYHLLALDEYLETGATVDADEVATICTDATGDVEVYCNNAVTWVADTYQNLQEQFSFAGAPYTVAGEAVTLNGTPDLFVTSIEAFTESETSSCDTPLESSDPCGPLASTNLTTEVTSTSAFAWRTDWDVATAEQWRVLLDGWTDDSQSLGEYLETLGFENTTNSTKVILTTTTYTAKVYLEDPFGDEELDIDSPAVCFLDTANTRGDARQPWCYNGSNDGVDYGEASDFFTDEDGLDCLHYSASSTYTDQATSDFFEGTWRMGNCNPDDTLGWVDGIQPGWLLDDSGASATQYVWPVFDMSDATCSTNVNGSTRSSTNPGGVYSLCGSDFDLWFAEVVPTPEVTEGSPSASTSSSTVQQGDDTTVTTGGWDTDSDLTVTANSEPLVLDRTQTDSGGMHRKTYTIPADFPVGEHTIVLDGIHDGEPYSLAVPITVTSSSTNPTPVPLTPVYTG